MKRIVVTKTAFKDLRAIWSYIAADNLDAADRVVADLDAAMSKLGETPGIGYQRTDVQNPSFRFWRVYSYLIAYRVAGDKLYVSRVIHGARDVGRLFNRPSRRR